MEKYPSHVVATLLGHSPKVAVQHYLMSREHHFEDVVRGDGAGAADGGQTGVPGCDAYCAAPATHFATQQGAARDSARPHETTEPAATTQVAAGSSEVTPFIRTGEMAGAGREQTAFRARNPGVTSACDAQCDALSADRVELLARAVAFVAGMAIPEQERAALLALIVAGLGVQLVR